jgi:chromosome segregation ATPase
MKADSKGVADDMLEKEKSVLEKEIESFKQEKEKLKSEKKKLQNRQVELKRENNDLRSEYKENIQALDDIDKELDEAVLKGDSTASLYKKEEQIKNRQKDIKRLLELKEKAIIKLEIDEIDLRKPIKKADEEIKLRKMYIFRKDFYKLKVKYHQEKEKHDKLETDYNMVKNTVTQLRKLKNSTREGLEKKLSTIDSSYIEEMLSRNY